MYAIRSYYVPFYADQRDETFPLIIAGGPCAFNPEPLADFFDAIVIGDGVITSYSIHYTKLYESVLDKRRILEIYLNVIVV